MLLSSCAHCYKNMLLKCGAYFQLVPSSSCVVFSVICGVWKDCEAGRSLAVLTEAPFGGTPL